MPSGDVLADISEEDDDGDHDDHDSSSFDPDNVIKAGTVLYVRDQHSGSCKNYTVAAIDGGTRRQEQARALY